MNTVLMVYTSPDPTALEAEERAGASHPEYANVASAMSFREPSLSYEFYRDT